MQGETEIRVVDLIGKTICVSSEDAQKVFDCLKERIQAGQNVIISFDGITMIVSLFLNVAIGQLYAVFDEKTIRDHLSARLSTDDRILLKRVVENAKNYYAHSKGYDAAWNDEVADDGE